tara:strand:- start:87 stop:359 length:273 start_codon:yes stop_codon:yes gene_type:complete
MLSQEVFKKGLNELKDCFDNFKITEEKLKAWYKYSKDMDDEEWKYKIASCIRGCYRTPTLADILDDKEYYEPKPEEKLPPYYKDYIHHNE